MDKTITYLNTILNKNIDTLVVCVSGGPDSMCLLHILNNLRENYNYNIVCAHINHNKRLESDDEYLFVKDYCDKNNIILEYLKLDNFKYDNFHNDARVMRYDFFKSLLSKYNTKYLFTAHHADDLIETILMRITRGSSLVGYAGFNVFSDYKYYYIIRPLIFYTKSEILEYLDKNSIEYVTDLSNDLDIYTRNRYRKYILPILKQENNKVHEKYLKFSNKILEYTNYIEKQVDEAFKIVYKDNYIDIDTFTLFDDLIKKEIIYIILSDLYKDDINLINDTHIDDILKLIFNKNNTINIILPKNTYVTKSYNKLIFNDLLSVKEYDYILSDNIKIDKKCISVLSVDNNDYSNNTTRLNLNEVSLPLHVRNMSKSDYISVLNMVGKKRVYKIFNENKINKLDASSWPIIVDGNNEILWIPGLKKSKFDKQKDEKYDIILKYDVMKENNE